MSAFIINIKILLLVFTGVLYATLPVCAQINITYNINTSLGRTPISPYIYGFNTGNNPVWSSSQPENLGSRRFGGNRTTGYNWENNFSNAGSDYGPNRNDNYLFISLGYPGWNTTPGEVLKAFHDTSLAIGAYSLVTAPMAGYVSTYQFATLPSTDVAPSTDWYPIVAAKGSAFSLTPNTTDNVVYNDEMVNWIVNKYGNAATVNGVKGYSLDNEPDYWFSTHPLIHGNKVTCQELVDKSTATANAIKNVDPTADVFGYASFGYSGYVNLQGATDWNTGAFLQSKYPWYIDAYLDKMKIASTTAGKRLVDVLDLHYYTEQRGLDNTSTLRRVIYGGTWEYDPGVCQARMQAPRSFWDPSFVENSWITSSNGGNAIQLIPTVKTKISNWWPGTKISFSEWAMNGITHVSGGIAVADVLGIFGKFGVYHASVWDQMSDYVSSGYRLFRNYDGNKGTFENTNVQAVPASIPSDYTNTSIYASVNNLTNASLHLIVLNKHWTSNINATFNITSTTTYKNAKIYMFNGSSTNITQLASISNISGNTFTYTLPNLTAFHIVLDNGALPLDLLDFNGTFVNEHSTALTWKTTSEKNLDRYDIYRNMGTANDWQKVGTVKAMNRYAEVENYYLADNQLPEGSNTVYYKLQSIDADGLVSSEKIISLHRSNALQDISLYPNPYENGFNVKVSNEQDPVLIKIKNYLGETVEEYNNRLDNLGASLVAGVYFIEVNQGNYFKVLKIVKR